MILPDYAESFLRAGWGAHESALTMGRKNGKSAICAMLALGHLVGPLRTPGWRGAVAALSIGKAAELRGQVAAIAQSSGLSGQVTVRRSPYPGAIESATGTLETLSADRTAGHASGFDLVLVDETGLLSERSRELLAGLRSSVSAKAGRIVHISVRGDSPLFREVLENPATVAHIHAVLDEAVRLRPAQRGTDPLPDLAGSLRPAGPDWRQDTQDFVAADLVNRSVADARERVALHLLHPIRSDLGVAPPWPVGIECLTSCVPKRWHLGPPLRGHGVTAGPSQFTILEGSLPCLCEAHERKAAQADVAALAGNGDALDPTPRPAGRDAQVERPTVAMHSTLRDGSCLGRRQTCHLARFPYGIPHVRLGYYRESNRTVKNETLLFSVR